MRKGRSRCARAKSNGILARLRQQERPIKARHSMQLEHLEARYALDAAPVANDDSLVALYQQPSTPFIEVLNNDTDADTLAFLLHVSKVNGANVSTSVGTPQTFSLPQGSLVLRADHQIFDFTPAANFTGSFSFRYNLSLIHI